MYSKSSDRKFVVTTLFGTDSTEQFGYICQKETFDFCELFCKMHNCVRAQIHATVHEFLLDIIKSSFEAETVVAFYSGHGDNTVIQCDSNNVPYDYLFDNIRKRMNSGCTLLLVLNCCFSGSSFHSANKYFQDSNSPKILIQAVGSSNNVYLQSHNPHRGSEDTRYSEFVYTFISRNQMLNFPHEVSTRINFSKLSNPHQPRIWINFKEKAEHVYVDIGGGYKLSFIDKWGTGRRELKKFENKKQEKDDTNDDDDDNDEDYNIKDGLSQLLASVTITSRISTKASYSNSNPNGKKR